MPKELILRKSAKITSAFKNDFLAGKKLPKCAMVYLSTQSEVRTSAIINYLLEKSVRLYVPCLENGLIVPVKYTKGCRLSKGAFKINEPIKKLRARAPKCIELVLVPGIAFDLKGSRVGFGRGYFDRFLKRLPASAVITALSFEKQIVKSIPADKHDIKMDYIITENRIIKCGAAK